LAGSLENLGTKKPRLSWETRDGAVLLKHLGQASRSAQNELLLDQASNRSFNSTNFHWFVTFTASAKYSSGANDSSNDDSFFHRLFSTCFPKSSFQTNQIKFAKIFLAFFWTPGKEFSGF
jgi:hypothetical protein